MTRGRKGGRADLLPLAGHTARWPPSLQGSVRTRGPGGNALWTPRQARPKSPLCGRSVVPSVARPAPRTCSLRPRVPRHLLLQGTMTGARQRGHRDTPEQPEQARWPRAGGTRAARSAAARRCPSGPGPWASSACSALSQLFRDPAAVTSWAPPSREGERQPPLLQPVPWDSRSRRWGEASTPSTEEVGGS